MPLPAIINDWRDNEKIQDTVMAIHKLAMFLNEFEYQARHQLRHIDSCLTKLERRLFVVGSQVIAIKNLSVEATSQVSQKASFNEDGNLSTSNNALSFSTEKLFDTAFALREDNQQKGEPSRGGSANELYQPDETNTA